MPLEDNSFIFYYTIRMKTYKTLIAALALTMGAAAQAQTVRSLTVNTAKLGAKIAPTKYGIFFEDINYGADGGLYAEKIKNRSFEFPQSLMGWNTFGDVELRKDNPAFDKNPNYIRLSNPGHRERRTGLENEGFFGVSVDKDAEYRFKVTARTVNGSTGEKFRVQLINESNDVVNSEEINVTSNDWKPYEVVIKAGQTIARGKLRIQFIGRGAVDMDHLSLFPVDTWKGRENGMRKDLAQALNDLHPGVFRFPGGCIVEGTDLASRYEWKNSIGPIENRPLNQNRWNYTFEDRNSADYFQTYGLGFYEYFLLSEDFGAEPLPILSCGLACQFQTNNESGRVPLKELQPYIDDALDLIEFANGDKTTKWGAIRASMGHEAPFNLKYIGIGNEQWDSVYPERLALFVQQIRAKYPKIQIIGSSGPDSEGKQFDYLWPEMKRLKVDLVDEHYYRNPKWFLSHADRYDKYDRKGPKVFAGEYACHVKGEDKDKANSWEAALCEAAFLTGIERNADVVPMATYAPLFAHVDGWQWRPDLIWFDNLRSVRSVNWYVQQLYGIYKGSNVVSVTENNKPLIGQNNLYASAVWDEKAKEYIVKVANTGDSIQQLEITLTGLKKKEILTGGKVIWMHNDKLTQENTLDNPKAVLPKESDLTTEGNQVKIEIGAKTFAIYRIKKG